MNVVITGANRGLGLGFVQHYLAQGASVWACYRSEALGLSEIDSDVLHQVQLDVSQAINTSSFPENIDLLINNAGIYGPMKGGQSLDAVTPEVMQDVFNIDCVGPLRVVQALKDKVVSAQGVIANMSSKMGSSADNGSGGTYAYRAAKAALVIMSKSMAIDLKPLGVRVITLHPGWVTTDMTNHTGLIDVKTSVAGLTQVIHDVDKYELGSFVAYDGQVVPF
ncbi:MAG: SDR family oxidoreductase [Ghiorsea sp.]